MDLNAFRGLNVLIFGGTSGIGLATAIKFALHGANKVIVVGRNPKKWENYAVKKIGAFKVEPNVIEYRQGDVRFPTSVFTIISDYVKDYDKIDIFHNNAGIGVQKKIKDGCFIDPAFSRDIEVDNDMLVLKMPYHGKTALSEYSEDVVLTNYIGMINCLNAEFRYIQGLLKGSKTPVSIVNTASQVSNHPSLTIPIYSSTKAAVASITYTSAEQAGQLFGEANGYPKVRVNCIAPGVIHTPLWLSSEYDNIKDIYDNVDKPEITNKFNMDHGKTIPLGRIGEPEEVASMVCVLSHPILGTYLNGGLYPVDGGSSIVTSGATFPVNKIKVYYES